MGKDKVDVLVIGAGASGAAFSWSLAQSGINVMCLEQGKWLNPLTDYSTFGSDWEIHRQTDFNPNPNLRANHFFHSVISILSIFQLRNAISILRCNFRFIDRSQNHLWRDH